MAKRTMYANGEEKTFPKLKFLRCACVDYVNVETVPQEESAMKKVKMLVKTIFKWQSLSCKRIKQGDGAHQRGFRQARTNTHTEIFSL